MAGSHSRREFLTLAGAAAASAGFEPDRAGPGGPGAVAHRFSDAIQAKAAASLHHRLAPALRWET